MSSTFVGLELDPASARLVPPTAALGASFVAALREGFQRGNRMKLRRVEIDRIARNVERHLVERTKVLAEIKLPSGRRVPAVPASLHWLVVDNVFVGEMSFRHELNAYLKQSGGNIGYGIRPSFRGHGFGKRLLALGMDEARRIGLSRLLLTCHENNPHSARIIEANGGALENTVADIFGGGPLRRYWIDL